MKEKNARDIFLQGNEQIEAAIEKYHADSSTETLVGVLETIRARMRADGQFIFPVIRDDEDANQFAFRSVTTREGKEWQAAFTSCKELEKGEPSETMTNFIDIMMRNNLRMKTEGIMINPWGKPFLLSHGLIEMLFRADSDVEKRSGHQVV